MCTSTVTGYTNAHYISKLHSKQFLFNYPCGHCEECKALKKSEWRVRAYYEAKQCLKSSSSSNFVLFDTLTYSDDHLPKLSTEFPEYRGLIVCNDLDTMIFRSKDLQDFLKRLRVNLDRAGYDVKDNLRYFVSSEFGDEKDRPHYHILFFVYFDIDPIVLSRFVSQAWTLGKTDGVRPYDECSRCPVVKFCNNYCIYQSEQYVLNNRVFRSDACFLHNVVNYVSKYVTKDIAYESGLKSKIIRLLSIVNHGYDWRSSFAGREEYKRIYRQCTSFHRESHNFGLYALQENSVDDIINNNSLPMSVSKKSVVVSIPLPMYYKRKLFYKTVYFNGSRVWIPNELGFKYLKRVSDKTLFNYVNRVRSLYYGAMSIPTINGDVFRREFDRLLGDRSISDYCKYVLYYRGRVMSPMFDPQDSFSTDSYNYIQLYKNSDLWFAYNTYYDSLRFHGRVVSDKYLLSTKYFKYAYWRSGNDPHYNVQKSSEFLKSHCVNDSFNDNFKGFDELFKLIDFVEYLRGNSLEYYRKKDSLQYERYKKLGFFNIC